MSCPLCQSDQQPSNFATPRKCAFDEAGNFTGDNWMCLTMLELRDAVLWRHRDDDSCGVMGVLPIPDTGYIPQGYLVLTWYKDRGCTGGARIVHDDEPDQPLTLEIALGVLAASPGGLRVAG